MPYMACSILYVGESTVCGDCTLNVEALLFDAATRAGMIDYTVENEANFVSNYTYGLTDDIQAGVLGDQQRQC